MARMNKALCSEQEKKTEIEKVGTEWPGNLTSPPLVFAMGQIFLALPLSPNLKH